MAIDNRAYHEFWERERVAAVAAADETLTDVERAVLDAITSEFSYIDIGKYASSASADDRKEWEDLARTAARAALDWVHSDG